MCLVAFLPDVRKKGDKSRPDAFIARLAAHQHGVVSTAQLRSAGFSFPGIDRRLESARLHRIHRGVYAVGHVPLSDHGLWMRLSSLAAKAPSSVTPAQPTVGHPPPSAPAIGSPCGRRNEAGPVTSEHRGHEHPRGIVLHRSSTLIARHCTRRHIPSPARLALSPICAPSSPQPSSPQPFARPSSFACRSITASTWMTPARISRADARPLSRHRLPHPRERAVDRTVDFLSSDQFLSSSRRLGFPSQPIRLRGGSLA